MTPLQCHSIISIFSLALFSHLSNSQLLPQNNTFNSSYAITAAHISLANLSQVDAGNIAVVLNFERSNWATGSVLTDAFYSSLPPNASYASPGSLLKLEPFVNTTSFTIAPTLALSRFLFQSANLNNTPTPSSAYILWPYTPRSFPTVNGTVPLIAWAHGNSGLFAECAPSHIRNLWYQFSAPYNMALHGYAVVGIDYTGLGVAKYPDGRPIPFQAETNPAAANDLFYAVEAAQSAFPGLLSTEFVVVGHSLGGGAAWAAAERQAIQPVGGYLGAIAGSPATNATAIAVASGAEPYSGITVVDAVQSIFPSFNTSGAATQAGLNYLKLASDLQMCNSALLELLGAALGSSLPTILSPPDWITDPIVQAWQNLAVAGGRNISGPLLILQGSADTTVPKSVTDIYVNTTCQQYPDVDLEYATFEEVGHVPVMYASLQLWLERVEKLFTRTHASSKGCRRIIYGSSSPRPLTDYSGDLNYFLEYVTNTYEVA
jgi:pimeloyl-ACP methyl ester carboxylesterase